MDTMSFSFMFMIIMVGHNGAPFSSIRRLDPWRVATNWAEFTFRQNKFYRRRRLIYLDGPCVGEWYLEVGKGKGKCRW
jgi:hypothetical protein